MEPFDHSSGERENLPAGPDPFGQDAPVPRPGVAGWLHNINHSPRVIALIRRARRALPGDPEFGDPLSTAGVGGPRAAARAADRLIGERHVASREASLGVLQVWQALRERVQRRPAHPEVTLIFTDLVGFSTWSLEAGDDATLKLLRRVSQAVEPPILDAGGHVVKRMGDGTMSAFGDPLVALCAALVAYHAVKSVEVDEYTPRMRVGIHTGHPQRMASDWLGVDVNIAARVMERATNGGVIVSGATLDRIPDAELEALGVTAKCVRRQVFAGKPTGVPAGLTMYRLKSRKEPPGADEPEQDNPQA